MASTAPTQTGLTYGRYLEIDDDERYEVLDGELLRTPAPETRHQFAVGKLYRLVSYFVEDR
jgi:hypothetical protein